MYLHGIGVKQNVSNALFCLSEASSMGNLYARANLIYFYYQKKMFTNVCYLACKYVWFIIFNIQIFFKAVTLNHTFCNVKVKV